MWGRSVGFGSAASLVWFAAVEFAGGVTIGVRLTLHIMCASCVCVPSRPRVYKSCAGTVKCVRSSAVMRMASNAIAHPNRTFDRWRCSPKTPRPSWISILPRYEGSLFVVGRLCIDSVARCGMVAA